MRQKKIGQYCLLLFILKDGKRGSEGKKRQWGWGKKREWGWGKKMERAEALEIKQQEENYEGKTSEQTK